MNTRILVCILGCLAGGVVPRGARAQLPEYVFDPVIVTATRTPTSISQVGSSVAVVTGSELRARGAATLLEGLAFVPGLVQIQAGSAAGTATVFMRGAKGDHLLVLVDGIEVNDPLTPGNSFDFSTFPTDAIERIEIVRGPQSTLYGSDAVAGVINIITRPPGEAVAPWATFEGGSYETLNAAAGVSGTLAGNRIRLEIARRQLGGISSAAEADGNTEPDDWNMWSGAMSLERQVGRGELTATLRGSRSRFDIDDFGGPFGDDPNALDHRQDLTGSVRYRSTPGTRWTHSLLLGATAVRRTGFDGADPDHADERVNSEYRGLVQSAQWQHEVVLADHRLTAGLAWERRSGQSRYASDSGGWLYSENLPWQARSVTALYVQDQFGLGPVALTLGGRIDVWSGYGVHPTMRAAAVVPIGRILVRSSIGTAFRTPSIYQCFSPRYGNADLEAERSLGYDLGLEVPLTDRARVGVSVYRQNVTDLIDFITDPTTWISQYVNRSEVVMQGAEGEVRLALSDRLGAEAGLTLMQARDETAGEDLVRRPALTATLGLDWHSAGALYGSARFRHVGKRSDIDFHSPPYPVVDLEPVTLVEAELGYEATEHLGLRVRLRNITDADPVWVWGYGAMGRAFYLGLLIH